ncbi:HAD-IA family hydrolase [Sediminibacterium sp.]|uniref:HAD-IA family hydrolase n=1 Tax=Sediminibacterium sp. TaxID=1917865 RepID=UPI0025F15810|nr:HAD-IA family hydrolase [Sediminibacterium sp.]MBT9483417.1 HAD-IA family hydrolase [Sediminibacterium sp.]
MKKKISMVVFDMAGTTINENNIVYKLLHQVLIDDGYDCSLDLVLAIGAGKEKKAALKDILIELGVFAPDNIAERLHQIFNDKLATIYTTAPIVSMDGAEELFAQLKLMEIKVVLNTGYDSKTAHFLLQKLHWEIGNHIDGLITASDVLHGRPSPDMIFLAMQQFHITDANLVVKIGDSIVDIEEGKNANCGLTIGITTGAQDEQMLQMANPDYIIHHLQDILLLIE